MKTGESYTVTSIEKDGTRHSAAVTETALSGDIAYYIERTFKWARNTYQKDIADAPDVWPDIAGMLRTIVTVTDRYKKITTSWEKNGWEYVEGVTLPPYPSWDQPWWKINQQNRERNAKMAKLPRRWIDSPVFKFPNGIDTWDGRVRYETIAATPIVDIAMPKMPDTTKGISVIYDERDPEAIFFFYPNWFKHPELLNKYETVAEPHPYAWWKGDAYQITDERVLVRVPFKNLARWADERATLDTDEDIAAWVEAHDGYNNRIYPLAGDPDRQVIVRSDEPALPVPWGGVDCFSVESEMWD